MLTSTQMEMIDTAAGSYKYAGSLEDLVKQQFGLSPTHYWQLVNQLLRTPEAAAYRPEAVARLNARRRTPTPLRSRLLG
ncbi:DUF3263 domain-containing protein [Pseudarthrobacter sp. HLT3-5]|uniref:DUF3263 domain-containing protein n=1 Tax=Pseudarthrobacter cellobiosi TaxID=2953654 RepID=UPI00208F0F84|nr:DUF3263 domain-containing protein [Pseudarthrobacter sp. HLT3-5]MCO4276147.1 DUF3263 domain-containing protein [Pseudarthrobacter sp. HLT3-5]